MREHLPAQPQDWTGGEEDAGTRELVRRFTEASVATDIPTFASMLRDDVRCSRPPTSGPYIGRDTVVNDWVERGFDGMTGLRAVPTSVNRQPAVAFYHWCKREGAYLPLTIDVLRITGGAIAEIITFHDNHVPAARPAGAPAGGGQRVVLVWTRALRDGACVAVVPAQWRDAAVAQAVGVDFEISDGGETIPLPGFAVVTGFFSIVGTVIAVALLRWSARPVPAIRWMALTLTAISLVPPLLSGANSATTTALLGLHLVAATVMIPTLARRLRTRTD